MLSVMGYLGEKPGGEFEMPAFSGFTTEKAGFAGDSLKMHENVIWFSSFPSHQPSAAVF